jgi:hypothetical protein
MAAIQIYLLDCEGCFTFLVWRGEERIVQRDEASSS